MKAKRAKAGKPEPVTRRVAIPAALGSKVKMLRDGSALVLDRNGGIVGLIEARPRYHTGRINGQEAATKT